MNYQELSPQGETLLKEIIDLQASGQDNAAYWSKRFDGLSMQQDTLLRDTFRELKECGYVHIQWADNIPYYLSLTVDGHNYFTNKKAAKKAPPGAAPAQKRLLQKDCLLFKGIEKISFVQKRPPGVVGVRRPCESTL